MRSILAAQSAALVDAFGSAMGGRSADIPLAELAIPLEFGVPALPCRGGDTLLRSCSNPWAMKFRQGVWL